MVQYYDYVNHNSSDFQLPRVGLFNSPNGFHGWGGNTPTGQLVDSYEMADGSKFSWDNPQQAAYPYQIEIFASMLLLCIMVLIGVNVRMIQ